MDEQDKTKLEKMSEFFVARLDTYEKHMLEICGQEAYQTFADLVPTNTNKILDLGCGTGLELDEIFKRFPGVSVVGIDLTQPMLDILIQKHASKNIKLICDNFLNVDLGENIFDAAVSFQSMHHFLHDEKVGLYKKICKALTPDGVYIESDYMLNDQATEDESYAENSRLRGEANIHQGELYHIDMPCTVANQISMLKQSGFSSAELKYRKGNAAIILAKK